MKGLLEQQTLTVKKVKKKVRQMPRQTRHYQSLPRKPEPRPMYRGLLS